MTTLRPNTIALVKHETRRTTQETSSKASKRNARNEDKPVSSLPTSTLRFVPEFTLRGSDFSPLASEGAAAAAAVESSGVTSLATLLTRHILRDGELVILILRPSIWFVPLSCLKFIAAVLIGMIAAKVFVDKLPYSPFVYMETGIFLLAGRLMWAVLQWMSRLYVLTDLRVVRISGVFSVNIFDCPLRKVATVRLTSNTRERIVGVGSIEVTPQDETCPAGVWQTIARPREVLAQIEAQIRKARHNGADL